jgi:hypothetical protein
MVTIAVPAGFYICYWSGRSTAMGGTFGDEQSALAYMKAKGQECNPPVDFSDTMHVVEVTE